MDYELEKQRLEALPYRLPEKLRGLLDGFKWAVHKKNTTGVILIDGRSGMGKTTLANQVGLYCDPEYDLRKVHWKPSSFLGGGEGKIGLNECKKGDFILFDEAMLISSRAAMSEINKMIVQAMSMIRSKNIIVGFCVNSIFDLDKNLALSRADLLLSVYGDSLTDRGKFMAFFKGSDGVDKLKALYINGKKYYDYSYPKSNFNSTFPSYFAVDSIEYEKQKQKAVNEFLSGETKIQTKLNMRRNKAIENFVMYLRSKNVMIKEIAEISGFAVSTIDYIISKRKAEESLDRVDLSFEQVLTQ